MPVNARESKKAMQQYFKDSLAYAAWECKYQSIFNSCKKISVDMADVPKKPLSLLYLGIDTRNLTKNHFWAVENRE
jgi:hypothetical protein